MFKQIIVSAMLVVFGPLEFADAQDSRMEQRPPLPAQAGEEPFIDYTHVFTAEDTTAESRSNLNTTAGDRRKKALAADHVDVSARTRSAPFAEAR